MSNLQKKPKTDMKPINDDDFDGLEIFLEDIRGYGTELITCEDCIDNSWCILHNSYDVLLCEHIQIEEE